MPTDVCYWGFKRLGNRLINLFFCTDHRKGENYTLYFYNISNICPLSIPKKILFQLLHYFCIFYNCRKYKNLTAEI